MDSRITCLVITVLLLTSNIDARKFSGRSSSSRGQSRRTGYKPQPAPTSFGSGTQHASQSAAGAGTGLSGWQVAKPAQSSYGQPGQSGQSHSYPSSNNGWQVANKPIQSSHVGQSHSYPNSQSNGWQVANKQQVPNAGQSHSYPSSQTGLSGNRQQQPPSYQESVQKNSYSQNNAQQSHTYPQSGSVNQNSHSYPGSATGLSGNSKPGYPHQGNAPPPYPGNSGSYPVGQSYPTNNYGGYHHPQGPPPPYPGNYGHGFGNQAGYGGGYGHGYGGGYGGGFGGPPGYFGGYKNYGGMSRGSSALTGIGLAGAGVGTLLTGLALWNLARSTGQRHHTVIYDKRGQPVAVAPANTSEPTVDPVLGELVNCSLTVSSPNATEVLAIPCSIATSFSPNAQNKASGSEAPIKQDDTKCIVGVTTKSGTDLTTTIPCSLLLNTAAENNVTEPPPGQFNGTDTGYMAPGPQNPNDFVNAATGQPNGPMFPYGPGPVPGSGMVSPMPINSLPLTLQPPDVQCALPPGTSPDPLNPCKPLNSDINVLPLQTNDAGTLTSSAA